MAVRTVPVLRSTGPVWADRNCASNPAVATFLVAAVAAAVALSGQPTWALFAAATVFFSLVDLDTHSIPVVHVRVAAFAGAVLLVTTARWTGASPRDMAAAAAITWIIMKSVEVLSRGDLGGGDVTLAPLLGIHAGWTHWTGAVTALAVSFVLAGAVAAVVIVVCRGGRRAHLPLAPFLFAGAWVAVLR